MPAKNTKNYNDSLDKDFSPYYKEHIQPLIYEYEQKRVATVESVKLYSVIAIIFSIMATLVSYKINAGGYVGDWIFTLLFFVICNAVVAAYYPVIVYRKGVQELVYPLIIKYFGDSYCYIKQPTVTLFDFDDTRLFNWIEDTSIEDQFSGSVDGVTFDIVHAAIFELRNTGRLSDFISGRKQPTVIFSGTCIILSMNKEFKGVTIFRRDKGVVGNFVFNNLKGGFSKIRLEDPVFEKKFEVSSTDQVEARYLLTTSFMERLAGLEEIHQCGLFGSFYNGKLMLLLPDVRWVSETQMWSSVSFIKESNEIIAQMKEILKIIEILNLRQNTRL